MRLTSRLLEFVPRSAQESPYWEPFLGGASLFLALRPHHATVSDANRHLMQFYECVKRHPDQIYKYLKRFSSHSSREQYYSIREQYNRGRPSVIQAARFLYLNRHSFNGVFRVNRNGEFNVPYGERDNYTIPTREEIHCVSLALQSAKLYTCSYAEILPKARRGEFVYLDPPYPPLNGTSFFTHYTPDRFTEEDQRQLACVVGRLHRRKVHFMMTNADVPLVRELYDDYNMHTIRVSRSVTCKNVKHSVSELVVTNYDVNVDEEAV